MKNHDHADTVLDQYKTADTLKIRQSLHRRFTVAQTPFFPWIFDQLALCPNLRVLECGCGDGEVWYQNAARLPENLSVTLTDLSDGMLTAARARLPEAFACQKADIKNLPFPDGAFDRVIANHMLYHVPDIDQALRSVCRVLAPGGAFFCSTIGQDNMAELWDMCASVDPAFRAPDLSFTLESGEGYLKERFAEVTLARHESQLYVTDADAIYAYIASMASFNVMRTPALKRLTDALRARIAREGGIRIRKRAGIFRCEKPI